MYSFGITRNNGKKVERKPTTELLQQGKRNKKKYDLRDYEHVQAENRRAQHDYLHSQQFQDDLRSTLLEAFKGLIVIQPTKSDCEQLQPPDLTPTEEARPEEAKKLDLDQFGSWSKPPLKQAEREEEIESKPTISLQGQHLDDQLKQEEGSSLICDHLSVQNQDEVGVFDGSPKAPELALSIVDQGDNFKTLSCELLIRPMVCLQISLVENLRVYKGLQQSVFEPGGTLCVFKKNHKNLEQKETAFKLDLQSSFTVGEQDLWSNPFEGREDGVIRIRCRGKRDYSGGNTCLIRSITDQNKLRREKQKLVVVKEKPKLESEYGDQCTRPPNHKKNCRQVELSCGRDGRRTWKGLYWMEVQETAARSKLNSEKEQCAISVVCNGNISPGQLGHVLGLHFFVFEPGGKLYVLRFIIAKEPLILEHNENGFVILQGLDLRTNPFKGRGNGAALVSLNIKVLNPLYGLAKKLIIAWLNGQFQGLIGMIYEVLDRERMRFLDTALKQLEQEGLNHLIEQVAEKLIKPGAEELIKALDR